MVTINPLNMLSTSTNVAGSSKSSGGDFSNLLKSAVEKTVNTQREAEKLTLQAAAGQDIPMQDVIKAIGEAEHTLKTMVTVRDKTIEAYQEILRMPI